MSDPTRTTPADVDPTLSPDVVAPHVEAVVTTCTARAKGTGQRCQRRPIRGATVCYVHGGWSPQARAAAARRLAVAKVSGDVRDAIAFEALVGVQDPLGELSRLASQTLAMKEQLAARINGLSEIRYTATGAGTEQLRAEVALYERALDRSARFLDLLAKSGFEERRVRLSERQGAIVAEVIRAVLGRLMLTAEQQALVPVVVPEELRRIGSAAGGADR